MEAISNKQQMTASLTVAVKHEVLVERFVPSFVQLCTSSYAVLRNRFILSKAMLKSGAPEQRGDSDSNSIPQVHFGSGPKLNSIPREKKADRRRIHSFIHSEIENDSLILRNKTNSSNEILGRILFYEQKSAEFPALLWSVCNNCAL